MKKVMSTLLMLSLGASAFASDRATYRGGTVALKSGAKLPYRTESDAFVFGAAGPIVSVPWAAIEEAEYGQKSGRRVGTAVALGVLVTPLALFALFGHRRQHLVTLGWKDEAGLDQVAVFEFDKTEIRSVMSVLKVKTGGKVTYQEAVK